MGNKSVKQVMNECADEPVRYTISDEVRDGQTLVVKDDNGGWVRWTDLALFSLDYFCPKNLRRQIDLFEAQRDMIRQGIDHEQIGLIDEGIKRFGSMRLLAIMIHCSPTYVSKCYNGHEIMSFGVFHRLHKLVGED